MSPNPMSYTTVSTESRGAITTKYLACCSLCDWSISATRAQIRYEGADFHRETEHPETLPVPMLQILTQAADTSTDATMQAIADALGLTDLDR